MIVQQCNKKKIRNYSAKVIHTSTVLSILLILWMEIMDGIGHNIFWIHCLLQNIIKIVEECHKNISLLTFQRYFTHTFKLLLILCIVTLLPRESVTQPAAYTWYGKA